jgi:hypothetical protein
MRGGGLCPFDLEQHLLGIAPPPVLSRLKRANQRVVNVIVIVRSRMTVRRVVTTSDVATCHAFSEMKPFTAEAETILTTGARRCHVVH